MLIATVRQTIRRRRLLKAGGRVLVACSGGPDSVGLADVLNRLAPELSLDLAIASVDHGLRPEAAAELELVRRLADRLSVSFHPISLSLEGGAGLQARARQARYEALIALGGRLQADRIAVGHTMDDQAETVLSRLLRGSSLRGMSGIVPRRKDGVIRPLIDCRRADVRGHLEDHDLEFTNDPSNVDNRFQRTRIRSEVLPMLSNEDEAIVEHLAAVADDSRDAVRVLTSRARRLVDGGLVDGGMEVTRLNRASRATRREALFRWAKRCAGLRLSRAQIEALEALARDGGEVWLRGGWTARRSGPKLVLSQDGPKGGRSRGKPQNH